MFQNVLECTFESLVPNKKICYEVKISEARFWSWAPFIPKMCNIAKSLFHNMKIQITYFGVAFASDTMESGCPRFVYIVFIWIAGPSNVLYHVPNCLRHLWKCVAYKIFCCIVQLMTNMLNCLSTITNMYVQYKSFQLCCFVFSAQHLELVTHKTWKPSNLHISITSFCIPPYTSNALDSCLHMSISFKPVRR